MRPLALALAAAAGLAAADEVAHRYEPGERVTLWLTKVGPYHNPQESYSYYSLPFCAPVEALQPQHKFAALGEVFEGTEWVNSDLLIRFGVPQPSMAYCAMTLDAQGAADFDYAIANHYIYQMTLDDLPIWGMVGEMVTGTQALQHLKEHGETIYESMRSLGASGDVREVSPEESLRLADQAFIFTHKRFSIGYRGDRIIEVNLTSDGPQHVVEGQQFDLSYSVEWVPVDSSFDHRYNRYLDFDFFEHHVHWFALLNSFLMAVFLVGVVGIILLRAVRSEISQMLRDDPPLSGGGDAESGLAAGFGDESGWKLLHADVFRRPTQVEFFAALLGTGFQLAFMGAVVIGAAAARSLYVDRGFTASAVIAAYALTSFGGGYASGSWYRAQFAPKPAPRWHFVMYLTASVLPIMAVLVLGALNFIAWRADTINTVGLANVATLAGVWLFVSLPLTVVGTLVGRRFSSVPTTPPRVNPMPRPVPEHRWITHPAFLCAAAGILPFACVFIEAYFVLTSFWGYKYYYVYGFLILVFIMLAIVSACATVVATYILLSSEDHRWQWVAFLSGASGAAYLFLYSIYYFYFRTQMYGLVQTAFYFGYTALVCLCIGLATGAIGYFSAERFVRAIYTDVKAE